VPHVRTRREATNVVAVNDDPHDAESVPVPVDDDTVTGPDHDRIAEPDDASTDRPGDHEDDAPSDAAQLDLDGV
jgi:hypothetical protein